MAIDDELSRKDFLGRAGGALLERGAESFALAAGLTLLGPGLARMAFAESASDADIFVCVFLRGACDALNFLPPVDGEDRAIYEAERPSLKIEAQGESAALKLDGRLGLHPSAKALHALYAEKKLAFVQAAGLTANTRSHFDAQAYMEHGTPDRKDTTSGWLARHLELMREGQNRTFLTAVSVSNLMPLSLESFPSAAVIQTLNGFNIGGRKELMSAQRKALRRMYGGQGWLARYGSETLDAIDAIEANNVTDYHPASGAEYPKGEIGARLATLAQLIKMKLGLRIATVDMGGWDTHKNQGTGIDGHFANQVEQLSEALHAFYRDVAGLRVSIVVLTEFGRRIKENASHGTDHGHGGVMMALGDHVEGGKIHGTWPGLKSEHLYERADLAVTTDYRQVLSELLRKRLKNNKIGEVFPGFSAGKPLGVFKG